MDYWVEVEMTSASCGHELGRDDSLANAHQHKLPIL
jgi:hypothetical protein